MVSHCWFLTGKFNPFSISVPLLYPLKRFSVFRGYRNGILVENRFTVKYCFLVHKNFK